MKRGSAIALGVLFAGFAALGLSHDASAQAGAGWITLFDGTNLRNFNRVGDANWTVIGGGAVQADRGGGFLVTKESYANFQIRAEIWTDEPANSGIFIRCQNPNQPGAMTCYEVNVFDTRPDPTYGTGAIVNVAKVDPMPKAAGQWNYMEIEAYGPRLTVTFNGIRTVDVQDEKFARGPFALQYGAGVVRFRNVQVRPL